MQNENKLCLIVISFLPTHMNHINGTDGVASHSFCFKYLSINCSLRLDRAIGVNLRFFDRQVAAFCENKRRTFLGEGETKIYSNFLNAVVFLLLTVCLIFLEIGMGANPGGDGGCNPPPPTNPVAYPPIFFMEVENSPYDVYSKPRKIINFAKSSPPNIEKWSILLNPPTQYST